MKMPLKAPRFEALSGRVYHTRTKYTSVTRTFAITDLVDM